MNNKKPIPLSDSDIRNHAKQVIRLEKDALQELGNQINDSFVAVCRLLYACSGKVVLIGLGKSGHIAKKIAATLASTGTAAFFVHASEAVHGDIGMLDKNDILIAISHSGETEELITVLSAIRTLQITTIGITSQSQSTLAKATTHKLIIPITTEACPHNLAPTSSTTATLALGDALAVTLFAMKNLTPEDFAKSHPAGSLGKRLTITAGDLAHYGEHVPVIAESATITDAIVEMTNKRLGCTLIQNQKKNITGIFTDGDLRRWLGAKRSTTDQKIISVMNQQPRAISETMLASDALALMNELKIQTLIVQAKDSHDHGIISVYDIISAGITNS